MKTYAYLCNITRPMGIGDDDDGDPSAAAKSKGILDWEDGAVLQGSGLWTEDLRRVSLPHGTMMKRAFEKLDAVGITDSIWHTAPPHPDSEIGLLMKDHCYGHIPTWQGKREVMWGEDVQHWLLNAGSESVWDCDGSYEDTLREMLSSHNVIVGSAINAIGLYLKAMACPPINCPSLADKEFASTGNTSRIEELQKQVERNGSRDKFIHSDHPILKHVDELYAPVYCDPEHKLPDTRDGCYHAGQHGRSMDIWNPHIVDVLEIFNKSLFGPGRKIGGLWLHLGGPFLWGETCHTSLGSTYYLNTPYAKEALGRDTDINMELEGRYYAPIIAQREARIAADLVERLKPLCKDFYFHAFHINPNDRSSEYQAGGMTGTMLALCSRLNGIPDVKIHMICSHAHECSVYTAAHVEELQREFPNIEFIAGVGWEHNLRTSGMARICEGYGAIEVGIPGRDQWTDLPEAINRLRQYEKLL